jgi:hypothetical protein
VLPSLSTSRIIGKPRFLVSRLIYLRFVSPLPYPISEAGLAVGIWFVIGIGYLIYLLRKHPDRIRDMDQVFD